MRPGPILRLALSGVAGYLGGSMLTADIVSGLVRRRSAAATDLRSVGSGNPGAANAFANLGTGAGIAILAGDIAKGAIAPAVGRRIAGDAGVYLAATTAVVGHCFPVWSRFRGGKGVATSAGTTLLAFPAYVPIDISLVAVSFFFSRHAGKATAIASSVFVASSCLWYARQWPSLWGAKPTAGLPLYAVATSAVIGYKFLSAPAHAGNRAPVAEEPVDA